MDRASTTRNVCIPQRICADRVCWWGLSYVTVVFCLQCNDYASDDGDVDDGNCDKSVLLQVCYFYKSIYWKASSRFAVLEIVRSSDRFLLVTYLSLLFSSDPCASSRLGSSSTSFYRSFLQRPSASVETPIAGGCIIELLKGAKFESLPLIRSRGGNHFCAHRSPPPGGTKATS